jgi:ABC-type sugar transport system permease subunit
MLDALNWAILLVTLTGMALLLRTLSRRLGEALRMKKYYYLYDASIALLTASTAAILLESDGGQWPIIARLLFLFGAIVAVAAAMVYWAWIFGEIIKPSK